MDDRPYEEAALRREVQQLHEQAAALHSSRASLSVLSRAAFQRGDGKLARDLSQRAAVLEAKISAAKETAARTAMRYHNNRNNNGGDGGGHGGGDGGRLLDVDLHGQTADTAVNKLAWRQTSSPLTDSPRQFKKSRPPPHRTSLDTHSFKGAAHPPTLLMRTSRMNHPRVIYPGSINLTSCPNYTWTNHAWTDVPSSWVTCWWAPSTPTPRGYGW